MRNKKMTDITSTYGSLVFGETAMKERLAPEIYKALKHTINTGVELDISLAQPIADAMMSWAIEKGATHYTHWFQPMTGVTAEKHESFLTPIKGGKAILSFSANALVKGEPDASSLPSGGLRATFEARGYTAWDPSSYAFIKDGTLCIPTAFCSYGGEILDKKSPLLRSMDAINKQAMRILKLFGNKTTKRVVPTCGAEQEYFLIDKSMYESRMDLVHCNRTLFGARPPKGQEMGDHYFGVINPRVSAFMKELDEELWKLGVPAKIKHNEAAPAQHELAPVYTTVNMATDQNQITMELMKSLSSKHNLACILHDKPFENVNGSGKHNNWSLATDDGVNLLEPGETPQENAQFLLFLLAVIKATEEYQDLLRISAASASNDLRLGGHEAPPAIISISLGEELTSVLKAIEANTHYKGNGEDKIILGATVLPSIPKDTSDRNRTSPFAFTGDKLEFRLLGSSFSIACTNYIINTIVADALDGFANILENSKDFKNDLTNLIAKTVKKHKHIIFNGNNYSAEWVEEAKKRGLLNLKTTVDALELFDTEKNIRLFEKHHILSKSEVKSRKDILLDNYTKTLNVEGLTMIDMTRKQIVPATLLYEGQLVELALNKNNLDPKLDRSTETEIIDKLSAATKKLHNLTKELEDELTKANTAVDSYNRAVMFRDNIIPLMNSIRSVVDSIEPLVAKDYWPFPTYADLLYSVK